MNSIMEPNSCTSLTPTHTQNFHLFCCRTLHSFSRKESRIEWRLLWFIFHGCKIGGDRVQSGSTGGLNVAM